jgi:hypothetical protein
MNASTHATTYESENVNKTTATFGQLDDFQQEKGTAINDLNRQEEQAHDNVSETDETMNGLDINLDAQENCTEDVKLMDASVTHDEIKVKNSALYVQSSVWRRLLPNRRNLGRRGRTASTKYKE